VLTVGSSDALCSVISELYAALDLPLDPRTVGAIADHLPDVDADRVANLIAELTRTYSHSSAWRWTRTASARCGMHLPTSD
jgi:hypothetical protein